MNRKVTVVGGAGNVGATVARGIVEKQLADVVVIDIADQKAAGIALDMLEACPIYGSDSLVMGTGDYAESAGSDLVVITSGFSETGEPGRALQGLGSAVIVPVSLSIIGVRFAPERRASARTS